MAVEAPDMGTFKPVSSYTALGVGYVTMLNPDGVRLDLSEAGAAAADRDSEVAGLLERMGVLISNRGGYKPLSAVQEAEPAQILRVGMSGRETARLGYRKLHLSSVYRPDAAPDTIVKAYDYDCKTAGFQFYLGAWLHERLAGASDGLSSPAQLAMFSASRFGHRTTVMDYVQGSSLSSLYNSMRVNHDKDSVNQAVTVAADTVLAKLIRITGWRGRVIANDLAHNITNIMAADPESATPENLPDREFAVIDQPVVRISNLPIQTVARRLPMIPLSKSLPHRTYERSYSSS